MNEWENCQASLAGAELTLTREDGNNPYASVTCRRYGRGAQTSALEE